MLGKLAKVYVAIEILGINDLMPPLQPELASGC